MAKFVRTTRFCARTTHKHEKGEGNRFVKIILVACKQGKLTQRAVSCLPKNIYMIYGRSFHLLELSHSVSIT
jgi:hypothetical protein